MVDGRDALVGVVDALRSDADVADALYIDTTTPSNSEDRERVYSGAASRTNDYPVEIAVQLIAESSDTSKSVVSKVYLAECTVVATETWFQEFQSLRTWDIFDAMDNVNGLAPIAYLAGQGREGGSDGIEVEEDTGRRVLGGRWQFNTHKTRY